MFSTSSKNRGRDYFRSHLDITPQGVAVSNWFVSPDLYHERTKTTKHSRILGRSAPPTPQNLKIEAGDFVFVDRKCNNNHGAFTSFTGVEVHPHDDEQTFEDRHIPVGVARSHVSLDIDSFTPTGFTAQIAGSTTIPNNSHEVFQPTDIVSWRRPLDENPIVDVAGRPVVPGKLPGIVTKIQYSDLANTFSLISALSTTQPKNHRLYYVQHILRIALDAIILAITHSLVVIGSSQTKPSFPPKYGSIPSQPKYFASSSSSSSYASDYPPMSSSSMSFIPSVERQPSVEGTMGQSFIESLFSSRQQPLGSRFRQTPRLIGLELDEKEKQLIAFINDQKLEKPDNITRLFSSIYKKMIDEFEQKKAIDGTTKGELEEKIKELTNLNRFVPGGSKNNLDVTKAKSDKIELERKLVEYKKFVDQKFSQEGGPSKPPSESSSSSSSQSGAPPKPLPRDRPSQSGTPIVPLSITPSGTPKPPAGQPPPSSGETDKPKESSSISTPQRTIKDLKDEIASLKASSEKNSAELAQKQQEYEQLQQLHANEKKTMEEKIEQLQQTNSAAAQAAAAQAQARLDEAQRNFDTEKSQLETQAKELREELVQKNTAIQELIAKAEQLKQLEETKTSLEAEIQRLKNIETISTQQSTQFIILEEELRTTKASLDEATKQANTAVALQVQVNSLTDEKNQLNQQLEALKNTQSLSKSEKSTKITNLTAQLAAKETELQTLQQIQINYNQLNQDMEFLKQQHKEDISRLEAAHKAKLDETIENKDVLLAQKERDISIMEETNRTAMEDLQRQMKVIQDELKRSTSIQTSQSLSSLSDDPLSGAEPEETNPFSSTSTGGDEPFELPETLESGQTYLGSTTFSSEYTPLEYSSYTSSDKPTPPLTQDEIMESVAFFEKNQERDFGFAIMYYGSLLSELGIISDELKAVAKEKLKKFSLKFEKENKDTGETESLQIFEEKIQEISKNEFFPNKEKVKIIKMLSMLEKLKDTSESSSEKLKNVFGKELAKLQGGTYSSTTQKIFKGTKIYKALGLGGSFNENKELTLQLNARVECASLNQVQRAKFCDFKPNFFVKRDSDIPRDAFGQQMLNATTAKDVLQRIYLTTSHGAEVAKMLSRDLSRYLHNAIAMSTTVSHGATKMDIVIR